MSFTLKIGSGLMNLNSSGLMNTRPLSAKSAASAASTVSSSSGGSKYAKTVNKELEPTVSSSSGGSKSAKIVNKEWEQAGLGSWVGVGNNTIQKKEKKATDTASKKKKVPSQRSIEEEKQFQKQLRMALRASTQEEDPRLLMALRVSKFQTVTSEEELLNKAMRLSVEDMDRTLFEISPAPENPNLQMGKLDDDEGAGIGWSPKRNSKGLREKTQRNMINWNNPTPGLVH